MATIITFRRPDTQRPAGESQGRSDNVLSMADWRAQAHPVRTATGVFFVTSPWGSSGDAA
ncbi:hypothetical protein [Ruegeria marina]|uniref:Uncharacterized protein n=1 Tax=Ruegeria marina TaxID=639004 RepID=A0A1G6P7K1_9RHOB|nr:hypothetical protein [Ruegeria marina]SDC76123.1 hypothetical protein SAMN04488239_103331 [Ruegeria marina]